MESQRIHFANYSAEGRCVGSESIHIRSCDTDKVQQLKSVLGRLSGDLDLPLETQVASAPPIVLRICSTFHAAYSIYYVESSAKFASLILTGTDEESEFELMQVFKFLLLDESGDEDPSDDEILRLLSQDQFDFEQLIQRPIVFQIRLSDEPDTDDLSQELADLDQCVAAAFLEHPQVSTAFE